MPFPHPRNATGVSWFALALAISLAGCALPADAGDASPDGLPSCWIHDCPGDPGATECGTCVDQGHDTECPPGFVCSCDLTCVKGPRSYDGGSCAPQDAGVSTVDAGTFDWPACDDSHLPGT
jgi:hypothetical protein